MRQVMARADIVVCHAGAGTLGWALEHGKAVVALPLQAEQTVAVLRLKESGLGQTLLDADPGRFRRALREAADSPSRRQAVQAFAAELRPSASNMAAIADVLAGWCAAPPGAAAEASGAGRPPSG
jgi:UDP:flavonoid glycosyltransferase YjiC (YdhE family)